jgi:hypothetical protein
LPVTIRFGGRPCLRKSPVGNRRAASDFVRNIAVLIDGSPEIALLAIYGDDDLVETPDILAAGRLALQAAGVVGGACS